MRCCVNYYVLVSISLFGFMGCMSTSELPLSFTTNEDDEVKEDDIVKIDDGDINKSKVSSDLAGNLLSGSRYKTLRSEFLHLDSETLSVIDLNELEQSDFDGVLSNEATILDLNWKEHYTGSWGAFGAKYKCSNKLGGRAVCFLNSGGLGQEGSSSPACGQLTGDSLINAQDPLYQCRTPTPWSGMNFWLGTNNNHDFIADKFYKNKMKPANRLCVEMELPEENLIFNSSEVAQNLGLSQVVNTDVLHPNLRNLSFHWGTYTSPRYSNLNYTLDEEKGGTYQGGGSHFYHNDTAYGSYPPDRVFAIDLNTIVACMNNRPNGVRSGMRMPYAWEPLATLGGVDANGVPQGASYFNHLTRIYFRFSNTDDVIAKYPLTLKINKFFMMYEDNDIQAATSSGAVVSEKMVSNGQYADHPFTIFNSAAEERTYRVYLFNRSALPLNISVPRTMDPYLLYDDTNGNGEVDEKEPLIAPYQLITLEANTDRKFIIRQTADYNGWYGCYERHSRCMTQGSFAIQELKTLRNTGIHTRLWEILPDEDLTDEEQSNFIESARYPASTNDWYLNKQFNTEKDPMTNPNLIRNTRDYQMARQKGGW